MLCAQLPPWCQIERPKFTLPPVEHQPSTIDHSTAGTSFPLTTIKPQPHSTHHLNHHQSHHFTTMRPEPSILALTLFLLSQVSALPITPRGGSGFKSINDLTTSDHHIISLSLPFQNLAGPRTSPHPRARAHRVGRYINNARSSLPG